jgi:hypothetical protein
VVQGAGNICRLEEFGALEKGVDVMQYKKDFCEFEPWGQAREIYERIEREGKLDELESLLEETFTNELPTETEINDLLAYDWEWVYEMLDIKEGEEEC